MKIKILVSLLLIFTTNTCLFSQLSEDLHIFGSMQSVLMHEMRDQSMLATPVNNDTIDPIYDNYTQSRTTFIVQQLDLFLNKYFLDNFNVFIDLEFKLNHSTEKDWGAFNLQEAWLKYQPGDHFAIQGGLLFPKFNAYNEIKNRLFVLPYIIRPVLYEQILSKAFIHEDFIPERAFVQMTGFFPVGDLRMEYAAFAGNSESSYIPSNEDIDNKIRFEYLSGADPNSWDVKLYGGRIGVFDPLESFKAGVSFTYDFDNRNEPYTDNYGIDIPVMGDVPRYRIGMDLYYSFGKFEFQGEYIQTMYNYNENIYPTAKLGNKYIHGSLIYNLFSNLLIYSSFDYIDPSRHPSESQSFSLGSAIKLNDDIMLKFQFANYSESIKDKDLVDIGLPPGVSTIQEYNTELYFLLFGVSVKF